MRLLIINPNTSKGVTARIGAAAEAVAEAGDVFTTTCPDHGPELIVTDEDARQAGQAVVETVRRYEAPCDGIILASFGNTGARAVRALRPDIPVIGIATAAFCAVRAVGGRFGIVTFNAALVPGLKAKAAEAGVAEALMGVQHVSARAVGDPATVQQRHGAALAGLCEKMQREGARSIVLGGGPLAGLAATLAPRCDVPVIDGTQVAVALMRALTAFRRPGAPRGGFAESLTLGRARN